MELKAFQKDALNQMSRSLEIPTHLICIAPTGSGKSLIYERLACFRKVLLITPLVALARQQTLSLTQAQIPVVPHTSFAKGFDPDSKSGVWILSPEKLQSLILSFSAGLQKNRPDVVVIDECHCLWEWGRHFRPAFEAIPLFLKQFKVPHSLWLTATLPFDARVDLKARLKFPFLEMGAFALPANLEIWIERQPKTQRLERLLYWINRLRTEGIIFVASRQGTERVARLLRAVGISGVAYHAGLAHEERLWIENSLKERKLQWVVATSAFGMGMNYAHLKAVILWEPPSSLLAYVQAIGRVGRGGGQAWAISFWSEEDFEQLMITEDEKRARSEMLRYYLLGSERQALLGNYFRAQ